MSINFADSMGEAAAELVKSNSYYAASFARKPVDEDLRLVLSNEGSDPCNLAGECDLATRLMLDKVYELARADTEITEQSKHKMSSGTVAIEKTVPTPHGFAFLERSLYAGSVAPEKAIAFYVKLIPVSE